jgi:hypothetical protein
VDRVVGVWHPNEQESLCGCESTSGEGAGDESTILGLQTSRRGDDGSESTPLMSRKKVETVLYIALSSVNDVAEWKLVLALDPPAEENHALSVPPLPSLKREQSVRLPTNKKVMSILI